MKKLLIPAVLSLFIISCTDGDDPQIAECQATIIESFDDASTFFYLEPGDNGVHVISTMSVYDATDSAYQYTYEYSGNQISKIKSEIDDLTTTYTPSFDGSKITKLSGKPFGIGITSEEINFSYSGDNISRMEYSVADPNSGTLYPYLHYEYSYNNGDLVSSKYYIDLVMLFSLAFGQTPTAPYTPEHLFTLEFEYDSQEAANPLYGQINLFRPEMSMGANLPTSVIQRDPTGGLIGSLGYEITFNEQGFPTLANSGDSFIDITYNCN